VQFEEFQLDSHIFAGIRKAGYTVPTPIQEQAIPVVLEGRDLMGIAQTGTGKSAAFVLPILQRLARGPAKRIRALILAPTRELAEQIHQTIADLGRYTPIRSAAVYGGVSKGGQVTAIKRGAAIVVACPGRLLDHLGDGNIDLSRVETLVLDEADRMCDMGFLPDIRRIIQKLPAKRQTLFFSATMPKDIRSLADSILSNPATIQIGATAPVETVSHALYPAADGLKTKLLTTVLKETATGRVLVFTRTKHRARSLAAHLEKSSFRVSALQGNMTQNKRQSAINGFRNGTFDILVATDIAARGIDVSDISHVINFDMPDTVDAYTHRIGRTGRANHTGEAFTFVSRGDEEMVREIERVLGARIERRRLPDFDYSRNVEEGPVRQTDERRRSSHSASTRPSAGSRKEPTRRTLPAAGIMGSQQQGSGESRSDASSRHRPSRPLRFSTNGKR
jgi:ATP-dependent RNA helicase RhlE